MGPDVTTATLSWLTAHPEGQIIVLECRLCQTAVRVNLELPSGTNLAALFVDEHERAHCT